MTNLHIAPGLSLPKDAVTQTFAILAKRSAGKAGSPPAFSAGTEPVPVVERALYFGPLCPVFASIDGVHAGGDPWIRS